MHFSTAPLQDTLLEAIGEAPVEGDDGVSHWGAMQDPGAPTPREEFFYDADYDIGLSQGFVGAIR